MEFVLVDDSVVSAYTERVSRIVNGVNQLQDKMQEKFGNFLGDDFTNIDTPVNTQTSNYSEPVHDVSYDNNVEGFDLGGDDNISYVDEPVETIEPSMGNFDEPSQEFSNDLDDDLDIDLDAMLEGITFDDNELEL